MASPQSPSRDRSMSPPRGSSIDERSSRGRSPVRQGSANNSVDETGLNIYVNGLSYSTTDHDLHKEFGKFGKIIECKVILDPRTRESRGFAFVKFASVDDGEKALVLNGFELGGRRLIVEKAKRTRAWSPTPGEYRGPRARDELVRDRDLRGPRVGGRSDGRGYDDRRRNASPPPYDRLDDRRMPIDRGGRTGRYEDRPYDSRDRRGRYEPDTRVRGGAYDDRGGYDSRGRERFEPERGRGFDDRDRFASPRRDDRHHVDSYGGGRFDDRRREDRGRW